MADFNVAIPCLLIKEGGSKYTEIAGDNGGGTKYGISKNAYPNIDIKSLTEQQAREIYKRDYWDRNKLSLVNNQLVAESIFEAAANMGSKTAAKIAQVVSGVKADGEIGSVTIAAINEMGEQDFLLQFKLAIIARYVHLCNQDRTQSKFLLGWLNRVMGGAS